MIKIASLIFFLITCSRVNGQDTSGLSALLDSMEKSLSFNGVVLVAHNESVIFHKCYGQSSEADQPAINNNSLFNIASVTKTFTSVGILKMVELQKLSLQDTIGKFFSIAPYPFRNVTIHQLLTHQSGLPQTYIAETANSHEEAARKIFRVASNANKNRSFLYSNANYQLLAIITEKVTGQKWKDYITEIILKPLNMSHTFFWDDKQNSAFMWATKKIKSNSRRYSYGFVGSTGLFSTADDLFSFTRALRTSIILNDSSRARLSGLYVPLKSTWPNSIDYYSYGLLQTRGVKNSIWTRGNEEDWGVSLVTWFPKSDFVIIVLSRNEILANGAKQHIFVNTKIIEYFHSIL